MPKKIIDKFTDLPVSRERKRQLRLLDKKLCRKCGEKLATTTFCLKHAIERRERQRRGEGSKKRNVSLTYRLERKGK